MTRYFYCAVLFLLVAYPALAQISGVVKDKQTGKVIAGANVFINKTSISSVSTASGEFMLTNIAPGFAELVIYKDSYEIFKSPLRIQSDKIYKLNLEIIPSQTKAKPKSKQDEEYKKNLQWFMRALLGSTENASLCVIENPKSISFKRAGDVLNVFFSEPLVVNNSALGYRIVCYIQDFNAGVEDIKIAGLFRYDSMQAKSDKSPAQWERKRLEAYWGSERHFFKSLVESKADSEGYKVFNANGLALMSDSLIMPSKVSGYFRVKLREKSEIRYFNERGNSGIKQTDLAGQISWIEPSGSIDVTVDGLPLSTQTYLISGYMAQNRLADHVPLNYVPTATLDDEAMDWKNFSLLREKVYLHTDRDYYYPREAIWFKAYFGYSMPSLRDTLSQTLYVELISPTRSLVDSKVCQIKEGAATGDFKLNQNLEPGQYYLRAYTNWMRNYGDSTFFIKPIPILKLDENIDAIVTNFQGHSDGKLNISSQKLSYKAREKVDLKFSVKDENGKPVKADLSVSVTDAVVAAMPIVSEGMINMQKALRVGSFEVKNKYFDRITHYMERGLSFKGVVKDSKNVATAASIQIIQGNMDNLISMETDETGEFLVTGLKFIDSLVFAFKPFNKKGKPLSKVDLLPREKPALDFDYPESKLKVKKEDILQRVQNTYQADADVKLLEEVEIKGTKLATDAEKRDIKVYSAPDYVVKSDRLTSVSAGTNFLVGLQGKVPGLQVTEFMDAGGFPTVRVRVRGGTSSLTGDTEPLILVDGVPFPNAQSLIAIDASQVDRVEVITRAVPQFGSRGTNGVIAIYTKSGISASQSTEKDYLSHKIPGYSRPNKFEAPDYSESKDSPNPDFRTTIFWKPDLKTDEQGLATTSFFSADLATHYRIVVEGVTQKGVPVRAVHYITIE